MRESSFLKMICFMFMFCVMTAVASLAQTFTTLDSLGPEQGTFPGAALVQATDGNLYGTATAGGAYNDGTVFKITVAGQLTSLQSFDGTDGSVPSATLIQGSDGNFYGTTTEGGTNNRGTVFKITAAGTLTMLYSFCAQANCTDGFDPSAGLVRAANGSFYGTTNSGGANGNCGTVFEITPGGKLTTLYSFCAQANCTDGAGPSVLVQGRDGNLYGITWAGGTGHKCFGSAGCGTVFKITTKGVLTSLYSFCILNRCFDGSQPNGLTLASEGGIYGTAAYGGTQGNGTFFGMSLTGQLKGVHSFVNLEGTYPNGVVEGTDGNFYGTTSVNGRNGNGTIFQITPTGTLTTLYNFCSSTLCSDGRYPSAGLVQDTDGTFYGTTSSGGYSNDGTVFSLSMGLGPFVKTYPTSGKVGAKVIILGNNLKGTTSVTFNGTTAPLLKVTASAIETSVPTGATTGTVTVTTPSGTLNSNVAFRISP